MISLNRIKFGDIFSNELNMPDLIMDCAFDSDNSEVSTFLNREAVVSESYDGRSRRISSFKYIESFAPKFTFLKKNFGDFTQEEVRALLKYLTSKDTTGLLEAYDDDSNVVSWASIGNFSEIQLYKIANKRVVGVTAVWNSISPFALSYLHTVTKTISSPTDNKITINIDTDDNKPVYPRVIINHGYNNTPHTIVDITGAKKFSNILDMVDYVENTVYKNGSTYYWKTSEPTYMSAATAPAYDNWTTIEVARAYNQEDTFESNTFYHYNGTYYWMDPYAFHSSNNVPSLKTTSAKLTNIHTDFFNRQTSTPSVIAKNNDSTEIVTLDGANQIASSSSTKRIFDNDFNWNWLELHDGKNEITVLGNCEVTLSWRSAIKLGEF